MSLLTQNLLNLYGAAGHAWLSALPARVEELTHQYSLSQLTPLPNLSYHYVLAGWQDTRPIILKLGLDKDSLVQEAHALRALAGKGIIALYATGSDHLLLERAVPGQSLRDYFPKLDEAATRIAAQVMHDLHQAPARDFPTIETWLRDLDQDYPIPPHYLQTARQRRDTLLQNPMTPVLLHGDLHHDNILQQGNGWRAIDPKGIIGESAYEVGAFIRNPLTPEWLEQTQAKDIIGRRIKQFADSLHLPPQRILDWCLVQGVLSWTWAIADNNEVQHFQRFTEILYSMVKL